MEHNLEQRHRYDKDDTSSSGIKYRRYRKRRLRGERMDSKFAQFTFLIVRFITEQYDLAEGKKALKELEILMYLTGLDRTFDTGDAALFTGETNRTMRFIFLRWRENGYIKVMEGHSMNKRRKTQYKASSKGRFIYRAINDYGFLLRTMSLSELSTSESFIKKNKSKLKAFNAEVNKLKEQD